MAHTYAQTADFNFGHIGWKSYKTIKKKAMEKEFSWSGLVVSFSIAFFIVVACAQALAIAHDSIIKKRGGESGPAQKIYRLEKSNYLNPGAKEKIQKLLGVKITQAAASDYQGEIAKWTDYLAPEAGHEIIYTAKIKNTGEKTWEKEKVFLETGPFLKSFSKCRHNNWLKFYQPAGLEKNVKPGETAVLSFSLLAPSDTNGALQENFQLVSDGRPIPGTNLRLFIQVDNKKIQEQEKTAAAQAAGTTANNNFPTKNATASDSGAKPRADFCVALTERERADHDECQTNPNENDSTDGIIQSASPMDKEPNIRIGLFNTTNAQRLTCDKYFDIYAGDDVILSGIRPNLPVAVSFDFSGKLYFVSTAGITKITASPIRFVPREKGAIMTLTDYINRPQWNLNLNDNQFRDVIEFQYSYANGKLWVINELPIENYLKGLAETSNYSPVEYQKVIATAARTYALYHYNRGRENNVPDGSTKHAKEHFHLDSLYDQVYRGYGSEKRLPRLAQAIDETRGITITYKNKIVVTPYFSRSDGRTRAWEEVWYGDAKAWLKSVAVPEDAGQELWGHGVGMSARGALIMTRDKGKNWKETLKYFYQGTELQKIYK